MASESYIDVVFDGPPGPVCGRFVEVENEHGSSIRVGEWIDRGNGLWALRIPTHDARVRELEAEIAVLRDTLEPFREQCHGCGGRGWYEGVEPAHDPRCDGSCSVGCPIPVPAQVQCPCEGGFVDGPVNAALAATAPKGENDGE